MEEYKGSVLHEGNMLLMQKEVGWGCCGNTGVFTQEVGWFLLSMGLFTQGSGFPSASVSARQQVIL